MTRAGEFAWFTGLALALHLGLWIGVARSGSEAAGSGGQASVSLMAASGRIADLVKGWTRPVDAAQTLATLPTPTAPNAGQPLDLPRAPAQRPTPVQPPAQVPPASAAPERPEALPQIDTNSALPSLPRFAPERSLRPLSRPAHPAPAAPAAQPRPTPPKPQAAPRSQPSGTMAQTAAGNGGGSNAGNKSTQRPATLSKAARQSLLARWGASIRNRVERRKNYPGGTRASGTVVLRVTVSRHGRLVAVSAAKSSGSAALDRAAIKAVRRARFPAAPRGLDAAQYHFNLPLAFTPK